MSKILSTYRALVDVTPEMEALRRLPCAKCAGNGTALIEKERPEPLIINGVRQVGPFYRGNCPTCKGTGLNPDQSKWWEALDRAWAMKGLADIFPNKIDVVFNEVPQKLAKMHGGVHHIHRHEGDTRPWPDVLRDLLEDNVFVNCPGMDGDGCENERIAMGQGCGDFCDNFRKLKDISFVLATQETASVFKSFGIKTLVEA